MLSLYSLSRCPLCETRPSSAAGLCLPCREGLFDVKEDALSLTLGEYGGKLERAVWALKFKGVTRLGGFLGETIGKEARIRGYEPAVVTAVPLHLRRRLERGFNQSALIGKGAAKTLGIPYRPLLTRLRRTKQQARLGQEARRGNVEGAFRGKPLSGEQVLLIDDVMTSGATLVECSLALYEAGAGRVYIAAVARAKGL